MPQAATEHGTSLDSANTAPDGPLAALRERVRSLEQANRALEREVVQGGLPARRAKALEEALLDGYETAPRLPVRARVPLAQAVGLFRLASRCFRHRERDWSERMTALVGRAEELTANLSRNHADA